MSFKIGDEVKEDSEFVNKNRYKNGVYNRDLRNLGRGRFIVSAVKGDQVTVYAAWYDNQGEEETSGGGYAKEYTTVSAVQLLPFPRNVALEEQYKETVERVKPQIEECLRIASTAIADAVRLADLHGVPFDGVSELTQQYTPDTLPDIDPYTIEEITGHSIDSHRRGWEQSAIC